MSGFPDYECFWISNVRILDPHCISEGTKSLKCAVEIIRHELNFSKVKQNFLFCQNPEGLLKFINSYFNYICSLYFNHSFLQHRRDLNTGLVR